MADSSTVIPSAPQLIPLAAAAFLLAISPLTLYRWTRDRRLPYYRHGRGVAFDLDDLREFLQHHRVPPRESEEGGAA
jgi:excisionase family DNA binding protein